MWNFKTLYLSYNVTYYPEVDATNLKNSAIP